VLGTLVAAVSCLTDAVEPVIPSSAAALKAVLDGGKDGHPIAQPTPLFPRLELPAEEAA
jgi:methionyl-tRNA synthetase